MGGVRGSEGESRGVRRSEGEWGGVTWPCDSVGSHTWSWQSAAIMVPRAGEYRARTS